MPVMLLVSQCASQDPARAYFLSLYVVCESLPLHFSFGGLTIYQVKLPANKVLKK
jgi:hypothetical protein